MTDYLIIWGIGILIFSLLAIWRYKEKPDDRLSYIATALALIFWPLSIVSVCYMSILLWIDEKSITKKERL